MARVARWALPVLFLLGVMALLLYYASMQARQTPTSTPVAALATDVTGTPTPASSSQTATATATQSANATATVTAETAIAAETPTATLTVSPTPSTTSSPAIPPTVPPQAFNISYEERFGLTGFGEDVLATTHLNIPFASYADWNVRADPPRPRDVVFWQMIRVREGRVHTPYEDIDRALEANPGATWLIGNEPDVVVQDNTTPQRYAELYHELYTYIKGRDASAKIAIGGVSQPTPLRRAYLDIVLDTYEDTYGQRMPIDVWNVHAFTLREEAGEWGIGIPPGMDDDLALLYEIEDHDNLDIFAQNIIDFREWMARRGYADRPLLVSEYGFLMPYDFGYTPEDVATFLQGSFEFLLTARNDTGFAQDGGRLVQWWLWFILSGPGDEFSASYLYDRESGQLTAAGEAYRAFVPAHRPDAEP